MTDSRHGVSLGLERIDSEFVLVFKAVGKLTHQDYEAMTPLLESAIKGIDAKHIKMLVDISEFSGCELRAAWDDFHLGMKLGFEIEKVAILGKKNWQEMASKVGSWFISGEMKSFHNYQQAADWLKG